MGVMPLYGGVLSSKWHQPEYREGEIMQNKVRQTC